MAARDDYPPGRCKAPGVHMWDEQYDQMCAEIDRLRARMPETKLREGLAEIDRLRAQLAEASAELQWSDPQD